MNNLDTTGSSQPGFFSNLVGNLSSLAGAATPLVSAIKGQTGSLKAPDPNTVMAQGAAQGTFAGLSTKNLLLIGGASVAGLIVLLMVLRRK